jgi:hypothetical protein
MNVILCILLVLPALTGWAHDWFTQVCLVGCAVSALWLPANPRAWVTWVRRQSGRGG